MLEGHRKHRQKHVGPYIVEKKINDNAYKLVGLPPGMPTTQNVQYLTLFNPSPHKFRARPTPEANLPDIIDGVPEWEVEEILGDRGTRENYRFLVKWANTPQKQWLPLRCLNNCCEVLRQYYEKNQQEIPPKVQEFLNTHENADYPTSSSSDTDQSENSLQSAAPDPQPETSHEE